MEAILGPPGDYTTGPTTSDGFSISGNRELSFELAWKADTVHLSVNFENSGEVVGMGVCNCDRVEQTRLESLLWRLKRQWRRWFPE
jgi:hypothetical protein